MYCTEVSEFDVIEQNAMEFPAVIYVVLIHLFGKMFLPHVLVFFEDWSWRVSGSVQH